MKEKDEKIQKDDEFISISKNFLNKLMDQRNRFFIQRLETIGDLVDELLKEFRDNEKN